MTQIKELQNLSLDQRAELVNCMRDWVKDCSWAEGFDDEEIDAMTDEELLKGVNRHYCGGIPQFITDSSIFA